MQVAEEAAASETKMAASRRMRKDYAPDAKGVFRTEISFSTEDLSKPPEVSHVKQRTITQTLIKKGLISLPVTAKDK